MTNAVEWQPVMCTVTSGVKFQVEGIRWSFNDLTQIIYIACPVLMTLLVNNVITPFVQKE